MNRPFMKSQGAYVDDIVRTYQISTDAGALEVIKIFYDQHLAGGDNVAEYFNQVLSAVNYFSGKPMMLSRANDRIPQYHLGTHLRDAIEKARDALQIPAFEGASTFKPQGLTRG